METFLYLVVILRFVAKLTTHLCASLEGAGFENGLYKLTFLSTNEIRVLKQGWGSCRVRKEADI